MEVDALFTAIRNRDVDVIRVLLKENINIDSTNIDNETPLFKATSLRDLKITKLLI